MKNNKKLLIFFDFVGVVSGMLIGYILRFSLSIFPEKGVPPLAPYLQITIFAALVWIILLSVNQIYKVQTFVNSCLEFSKIIQSSFYACLIISAMTFFYRGFSYSRIALGLGILTSFIFLSLIHLFFNLISKKEEIRFFLVGNKNDLVLLSKRLTIHGANFIKIISPDELKNSIEKLDINRICVIICLDDISQIHKIERFCDNYKIPYFIYPKISHIFLSGGRVEDIDGFPVITTQTFPLEMWHNKTIKRFSDITLAMLFLCLLLPIIFIIATIIKFHSPGPVIFVQDRVGYRNKKFKILKFRTMKKDESFFLPYTLENDPRITKIGKFLRRFNLDEIPQLFNVLKGDMSIVGPRPISIDDKLFFSIPGFYERVKITPGMTGWAQIHGLKGGQTEPEERFRYDLYYAENWSIWLDLAIIMFTLRLLLKR
ncbi:MAG: exopolysaccharide biosynthesis polyprenyl glycosylphosphotransferase [Candidatus Omnitrophica bacterium]|nr:exopolysaccharide biosynthesis polyprenyl glycosylphosphotransferase [Candidatus Omnitrophota bacterium]